MNIITSYIFLILKHLVFPMVISFTTMTKNINFPNYVTSCIKCAFFISLVHLTSFFNPDAELMITNWKWITIGSVKVSQSMMFDFF